MIKYDNYFFIVNIFICKLEIYPTIVLVQRSRSENIIKIVSFSQKIIPHWSHLNFSGNILTRAIPLSPREQLLVLLSNDGYSLSHHCVVLLTLK